MSEDRIRELNDIFRRTFKGGRVLLTTSVDQLPDSVKANALMKVSTYAAFDEENFLHSKHDFGSFELVGRRFLWRIDYYDSELQNGSDDPADPAKTTRVLTLMLAEDY